MLHPSDVIGQAPSKIVCILPHGLWTPRRLLQCPERLSAGSRSGMTLPASAAFLCVATARQSTILSTFVVVSLNAPSTRFRTIVHGHVCVSSPWSISKKSRFGACCCSGSWQRSVFPEEIAEGDPGTTHRTTQTARATSPARRTRMPARGGASKSTLSSTHDFSPRPEQGRKRFKLASRAEPGCLAFPGRVDRRMGPRSLRE
jgi:hypothetical protein